MVTWVGVTFVGVPSVRGFALDRVRVLSCASSSGPCVAVCVLGCCCELCGPCAPLSGGSMGTRLL